MSRYPGCYSSIISFDKKDDYCQECIFFEQCAIEVEKRLAALRKEYDVDKFVAKRVKTNPIVVEINADRTRGKSIAEGLIKQGVDGKHIANELLAKRNPFLNRTTQLRVPCEMLIRGGYTERQLALVYMTLGHDRKEAFKRARIVSSVLENLGVTKQNGFKIEIRIPV